MDNKQTGYSKQTKYNEDRLLYYFDREKVTLLIVTVSGILYNVGMTAGPWFEGQLTQRLLDIMSGRKAFADMVSLALLYVLVIGLVQVMRFVKRLYVRKFANNVNRNMKQVLYDRIIARRKEELDRESAGSIMTKAISDVDTCVEGMRKFTTEVFDTGVVMVSYIVMLLIYDWRLALLTLIFPPVAYFIAEKLKTAVSACAASYRESAGRLNTATMDRVSNAVTYRLYGQDANQDRLYEERLSDYEKKAVRANIWESAMQPVYRIISMMSIIFILWIGGKNVLGTGFEAWNIAAFTTFLSCFMKLAVKSSKAAKLFNSVQKAKVSWNRIRPYLSAKEMQSAEKESVSDLSVQSLVLSDVSFRYPGTEKYIIRSLSITVHRGQIIGVAGSVAGGKSTFGRLFLSELPYEGHIKINGMEFSDVTAEGAGSTVSYMGHSPELLSTSIEDNILLGADGDVWPYLKAVCMDEEVGAMPDGVKTLIGNGGVRLSGGQQARIALARTLYHKKSLIVLDDPFSAVDHATELQIMENIRPMIKDCIVFIISHRLAVFPMLDGILWLPGNIFADHETQMSGNKVYAAMYGLQTEGTAHGEE